MDEDNLHVCTVNQQYQKHLFIVPTDAHYYKIIEMLKQFKIVTLLWRVSVLAETIIREQFCAYLKLQVWFSIVLVGIDAVNVMAAYSAYCAGVRFHRTPEQQADMPP
jgi:hypothetical protein